MLPEVAGALRDELIDLNVEPKGMRKDG